MLRVHGFAPDHGRDPHDVDEVVGPGFHLETMDDGRVWLAVYEPHTGRRVSLLLMAEGGKLAVRVQDDDRTADEKASDTNKPASGEWGAWHFMYDGGE